jgi:hypothetical protein
MLNLSPIEITTAQQLLATHPPKKPSPSSPSIMATSPTASIDYPNPPPSTIPAPKNLSGKPPSTFSAKNSVATKAGAAKSKNIAKPPLAPQLQSSLEVLDTNSSESNAIII